MKATGSIIVALMVCVACSTHQIDASQAVGKDLLDASRNCDGSSCELPGKTVRTIADIVTNKCPVDMSYVAGEYCTAVNQVCASWRDSNRRVCDHFVSSECIGKRIHEEFCVDTDEYVSSGQELPTTNIDMYGAATLCANLGKRLCTESEWNFACEGEEVLPYATGYDRPDSVCNIDIPNSELGPVEHRTDHRKNSAAMASCASPFGVRNMNGNCDEMTIRDVSDGQYSLALKGGAWMSGHRNRCRPATTAHSELYSAIHVGFRCCSDIQ
jgi:formylglycine-generating enzyme